MKAIYWPSQEESHREEIEKIRDSFWHADHTPEIVHHSLWSSFGGHDKVCIGDGCRPSDIIEFVVENPGVFSYLQKNSEWFGRDLETALHLRQNPELYFRNPGQVMLPNSREIWSWEFRHKNEKTKIREQLIRVLANDSEATRDSIALVFEELFMNASIDAPREAMKLGHKALDPQDARSVSKITLARSENRLSLSCEDPYGTLNSEKFVRRMNEVYIRGAGQAINFETERGGAGLGCVLLFENSATMVLGVAKNFRTVVSCVIPTQLNHRQRDLVKKSIHIVELEGGL